MYISNKKGFTLLHLFLYIITKYLNFIQLQILRIFALLHKNSKTKFIKIEK